jgi:NADPH:quinone reductase-like Zn-dependent oxidoreductase
VPVSILRLRRRSGDAGTPNPAITMEPAMRIRVPGKVLPAVLLAATQLGFAAGVPTMKAIRYSEYGPASVLKYVEVDQPQPAAGELLVKVHAAGVNTIDWELRKSAKRPLPVIPGFDFSGEVVALGEGATGHRVGDQVYAMLPLKTSGTYAEYVTVSAAIVASKPQRLDHVQAAAVPMAALTAYQALFDTAGLKRGQTVLIHGAGGGVGHMAVQLAKNAGATVIGTGSQSNGAFIKQIGADVFVDYRAQKFEDVAKEVDVVLDTVGGETLQRSYGVLKKGGIVVSLVADVDEAALRKHQIRGKAVLVVPNAAELAQVAQLIDAGKIKPEINAVFPLQEAAKAHEQSQTGHMRGRLVLRVDTTGA